MRDVRECKDRQLVDYWNDGDGSLAWLDAIERELRHRGYVTRSTDPADGLPRVGGERAATDGARVTTMDRNEYGRAVSSWFEYAAMCLQRVGPFDLDRAAWEAFGGMSTAMLATYDDAELRASIRGRLLALEAWKARHGIDTPSLPALREGRGD